MRGNGRFQWSGSGWLGASLGSTAWMLVAAGFLFVGGQPFVALIPLACFVLSLLVASVLWSFRDRLQPFLALQFLLAILAVTMPTAWISTQMLGLTETLARMNWPTSLLPCAFVLIASPALMLWFYILERRHSKNMEPTTPIAQKECQL